MRRYTWKTISSRIAHANPHYRVREDAVVRPSGIDGTYYVIETDPSVMVVPIASTGEIYLILQQRYPTKKFSWEVPAGTHDDGGSDLENARRELREETGLISDEWTKIGEVQVMSGIADHKSTVFIANNVRETTDHMQEEEGIVQMRKETFRRVFDLIRLGELNHSETIMAVTLAALHLKYI
jgi:8-oxo-dGTP pyrophosphatase MutT (NUDIX family)